MTFWHSVRLFEDDEAWRITWSLPDYDECLLKLSWDFRKWINFVKVTEMKEEED